MNTRELLRPSISAAAVRDEIYEKLDIVALQQSTLYSFLGDFVEHSDFSVMLAVDCARHENGNESVRRFLAPFEVTFTGEENCVKLRRRYGTEEEVKSRGRYWQPYIICPYAAGKNFPFPVEERVSGIVSLDQLPIYAPGTQGQGRKQAFPVFIRFDDKLVCSYQSLFAGMTLFLKQRILSDRYAFCAQRGGLLDGMILSWDTKAARDKQFAKQYPNL
jgi:hypothetical protein